MTDARNAKQAAAGEADVLVEIEAEVARDLEEERPPTGGPLYQLVGGLVAFAIGIAGTFLSYGYGLGSLRDPGPGLWPFLVSVAIAAMSAALLVTGRRLQDSEAFTLSSAQPMIGVVTFVVLALLMPLIGFEIPSFALCLVWLRFLGGESWRTSIVIGAATTAAFYLLFLYGLKIPLPHLI
jgi:hypothetical protein